MSSAPADDTAEPDVGEGIPGLEHPGSQAGSEYADGHEDEMELTPDAGSAQAEQSAPAPQMATLQIPMEALLMRQTPLDPAALRATQVSDAGDGGGAAGAPGSSGGGGGGGSSVTAALSAEDAATLKEAKEQGNRRFAQQMFGEAAEAYTAALRCARQAEDVATLLSNRSAAYASLSQMYRSRPAQRSERAALFDLDPTSLAHMALKDAERALKLRPQWAKAWSRQALALFLLERYHEAQEAYLEGLFLEPTNKTLQEGLTQVQGVLQEARTTLRAASGGLRASEPGATSPGAAGPGPVAAAAAAAAAGTKRQRSLGSGAGRTDVEDWECVLCCKLLYEPVTTPCGHTFCRECLARATDHAHRCPMCRTLLHIARELPVTITLANILEKAFPEEYAERRMELLPAPPVPAAADADAGAAAAAGEAPAQPTQAAAAFHLPLFVMSVLMPGESMALNIFEPRYRLMVRRCMEGGRRLGMAQVQRFRQEVEDVAVEAEIIDCQPQPDGRYYLELVGRRRVKLLSCGEVDGYRVGRCQVLEDAPPQPGSQQLEQLAAVAAEVDRLVEGLLGQLRPMAGGNGRMGMRLRSLLESVGDKPPLAQHEKYSFWVSALACALLPDTDKVALLRSTDTRQRLTALRDQLRQRATPAGGAGQGCAVM